MLQHLLTHLDCGRDRVIYWQKEMTARPALGPENGGNGEADKAEWLTKELCRLGLANIRQFPCPDKRVPVGFRPNIAVRIPGKQESTLWVVAHMDVVPPGEENLWQSPPFELRVDGDYLYGRGVEDNQQAIATALLAAESLTSNKVIPPLGLGLLFVSDEETGMAHGLPHVLAADPHLIREQDMLLVPDMGNRDGSSIEVSEKSCLWLRITVTGRQCHASTPDEGINSLIVASACVLEMERLYRVFRKKNPLFSPAWSTFVPSKKEANVPNINTLPGRDVFYLDCRILPEYNLATVKREVRAISQKVAAPHGATISIDVVHGEQAPSATSPNAPVVQRLFRSLRGLRGVEPLICGSGGQTLAATLRRQGLDAAVWATLMPNPHVPNECSRISATIADAKVVLAMLFDQETGQAAVEKFPRSQNSCPD